MRLRIGSPRALLVVAPHPDDETIGAFGLMSRMRGRGVHVRVLVVSDGAGSHRASRTWPEARLVRERRRETRMAIRRVGVFAHALTFLELPDGCLAGMQDEVARLVRREVRRAPKPLLLVCPSQYDDHSDHRVVANCIAGFRSPGIRRLAYPVWPAGAGTGSARLLNLSGQRLLAKRCAIRSYRTQIGKINDDPAGFRMTARQIAAFSRPVEPFVEL